MGSVIARGRCSCEMGEVARGRHGTGDGGERTVVSWEEQGNPCWRTLISRRGDPGRIGKEGVDWLEVVTRTKGGRAAIKWSPLQCMVGESGSKECLVTQPRWFVSRTEMLTPSNWAMMSGAKSTKSRL